MTFSSIFTDILVPYDGSKFSKKAVKRAIELSDKFESKVHLFSVINVGYVEPPGSLLGLAGHKSSKNVTEKLSKRVKKDMERSLRTEVSRFKKHGRTADYHVATGNIVNEILKFAKKKKITLIIMGSQGLRGLSRFKALGSVSRKVSEFAKCPVLIVR